jgi:hypothetical protein
MRIEDTMSRIEGHLLRLGLNNPATSVGALELLAKEVHDGAERIASAIDDVRREVGGDV